MKKIASYFNRANFVFKVHASDFFSLPKSISIKNKLKVRKKAKTSQRMSKVFLFHVVHSHYVRTCQKLYDIHVKNGTQQNSKLFHTVRWQSTVCVPLPVFEE